MPYTHSPELNIDGGLVQCVICQDSATVDDDFDPYSDDRDFSTCNEIICTCRMSSFWFDWVKAQIKQDG